MRVLAVMLLASATTPAFAQDHSGHSMPPAKPDAQTECEQEVAAHRAMGHAVPKGSCPPDTPAEHMGMDHSQMDHSQMDHSAMGAAPIPQTPPPAAAGSGPARAADAIWGAEAMRTSREALVRENGGMNVLWLQGDRLEYRAREGHDGYLWDVQGYYGGDIDKFWFKSEGEGTFGEEAESAEIQGLWSHAIGPWFDLQTGIRQDLTGPERTYAVLGVQGLAPYLFEVDAAAFLSNKGDLTARVEAELDQRITQRLILQPRAEANLSAQDVPELGIGAGLSSMELGLRLRYEFAREFAPYVGVEQEWKLGGSADYARLAGEQTGVTNYLAGIRFWF
ncbi:copper resistance protein B [Aurantiacibacter suaedae]|uniref:copper resistance protein B n=1 Tax=Aurantiacibacter suaedae TaxID=2545755 RepID=UPI0010F5919D|nr:copper resistance protein B [Aurantiacibacter suaedae]